MSSRIHSEAADLEIAEGVRRFVEVLRQFASGAVGRAELQAFARAKWPSSRGQGTPFPANGATSVAFGSCWNATDLELRPSDVDAYVQWLTVGTSACPVRVCAVTFSAAQLGERLSLPTVRYLVDGLGWVESLEFASPITGRQFSAESSVEGAPRNSFVRASDGPPEPSALLDLCNTLGIDGAECFLEHEEPIRWLLWRQDDNGHRSVLASFSALLKARNELARLESSTHKQMYWIEEATRQDASGVMTSR